MKWITEHNIKILDIDYKTKTCRVDYNGRFYGCPMRKHENNWYFSVDDRCVWYLAKDVKIRTIEEIIEELESRKDYGAEYAQAMEDVIVILKAKFDIGDGE